LTTHLDWVRDRLRTYERIPGHLPQIGDDIDHWALDGLPLRPAAVLVAVVARREPTLLLTRRNAALRTHAGQVAFPGGRLDADEDAVTAALREAFEETALPPDAVEVIAPIDDYATGTGFRVTPVVGIIPPDLPLVPAEQEVESLFEVPLAHVLDPANHQKRSGEWKGRQRSFYVIPWQGSDIWGATAGMIVNFSRIVGRTV
jgi:8-oxo-dGTP pyrophosphatase MutT (NUDIX family)